MSIRFLTRPLIVAFTCILIVGVSATASASRDPILGRVAQSKAPSGTFTGFIGGAQYLIEIPSAWNGTLLLFSHGLVPPTSSNPPQDAPDRASAVWLLAHGFALAGSSYSQTGWAVAQALHDQIVLLNYFNDRFPRPVRTIAWGQSLGGLVTAGLVQRNHARFAGALPMCGVLAGSIGNWNVALDGEVALQTLLDPKHQAVTLVHINSPILNILQAESLVEAAKLTPQGRARLALIAAMADLPGWFDPASPEPAATNYAVQLSNQIKWLYQQDVPLSFGFRTELELRAQGNPSWNTGVDYRQQLARSVDNQEVQFLYHQAGLNLSTDLASLQRAPRIAADPRAVRYLQKNITLDGRLPIPVLTMHTTGDGLVPVQQEQSFSSVVRAAHQQNLLRQIYVHRAGHCTFTPAEEVTGLRVLLHRLNVGHWSGVHAIAALNQQASSLGASMNSRRPAFVTYQPAVFLRP